VRGRVLVRLAAGEEDDPGHRGRHVLGEAVERRRRDLLDAGAVGRLVAAQHHVRLEERPGEVDALVEQLRVDRGEDARGDDAAALDRVRAVLQDLRLDDRDDARLLAQRRVPGERVRVRPDAVLARQRVRDGVRRAPLREARAEPAVLGEALAQPVQAFGDRLALGAGERLRARVDLDAGDDPLRGEQLGERRPIGGALAERLVVEDDAADELLGARRREEEVAIRAPVLLRRLDPDRVEALLDRAARLVGGEDPLPLGDERARGLVQFAGHSDLLSSLVASDYCPATIAAPRE
jgi:hypothetical protein